MRPSILDPLFASATNLPGVGPKVGKLLDKLVGQGESGARVLDLLFHLPTGTIDRRHRTKIADAPLDQIVMIEANVVEHRIPPPRSRAPHKVLVEDETGDVLLIFFLANPAWIEKSLPVGERRFISGKLELWEGHRQMVHPDRIVDAEGLATMPLVEPVYGLTEGLAPRALAKIIGAALTRLPKLPDWLAHTRAKPPGLPSFSEALEILHHPAEPEAIASIASASIAPARLRLAFDELLAHQLALALTPRQSAPRSRARQSRAMARAPTRFAKNLPFSLTAAQENALAEIRTDLAAPERMLRLLQGDVGSGKTIVALLAMTDVSRPGARRR